LGVLSFAMLSPIKGRFSRKEKSVSFCRVLEVVLFARVTSSIRHRLTAGQAHPPKIEEEEKTFISPCRVHFTAPNVLSCILRRSPSARYPRSKPFPTALLSHHTHTFSSFQLPWIQLCYINAWTCCYKVVSNHHNAHYYHIHPYHLRLWNLLFVLVAKLKDSDHSLDVILPNLRLVLQVASKVTFHRVNVKNNSYNSSNPTNSYTVVVAWKTKTSRDLFYHKRQTTLLLVPLIRLPPSHALLLLAFLTRPN
jgi:hypothetical protein